MSISNDDLVNATTPEALAKLMADAGQQSPDPSEAPQGEGAADAGTTDSNAVDAAAPTSSTASPAPGATPGANDEGVTGISTKSGAGVLPYRVLQEARQEASESKAAVRTMAEQLAETQRRLEEAQAQLQQQQAQAGVAPTDNPDDLTDEDIAAVEADFPAMAKAMRVARAAAQAVQQSTRTSAAAPAPDPQEQADEEAAQRENALAGRDLLQRARAQGGVLWARAVEIDNQLRKDPGYSKTAAERFAEVEKQLAKELGLPVAAPSNNTPANPGNGAPHIDPIRLNTTSDLIGGEAPGGGQAFSQSNDGMAMARRFQNMDVNAIDAVIRRSA